MPEPVEAAAATEDVEPPAAHAEEAIAAMAPQPEPAPEPAADERTPEPEPDAVEADASRRPMDLARVVLTGSFCEQPPLALAEAGFGSQVVDELAEREVLFDLETSLREVYARDGKSPLFDRLVKTRTNLLRRWAAT